MSVASLGWTVASNVTVSPAFRDALALSSVTLVTGVATTVTAQVADLSPALAVIVVVPTLTAVTTPLLTVATEASEVLHITVLSVASSGLTVAVKEIFSPIFSDAEDLSKSILVTSVATTSIVQEAVFSPAFAKTVAEPILIAETTPSLIVAISSLLELQMIVLSVVFSGFMVAEREIVSPTFSEAFLGLRVRSSTYIGVTFTIQVAHLSPHEAFMLASPTFKAEINPPSTFATDSFEDDQKIV